ncbi:hypothetical protein [Proteus mirabilis]
MDNQIANPNANTIAIAIASTPYADRNQSGYATQHQMIKEFLSNDIEDDGDMGWNQQPPPCKGDALPTELTAA